MPQLSLNRGQYFGLSQEKQYLCLKQQAMDDNIKDDQIQDIEERNGGEEDTLQDSHSDYKPADRFDASAVHHLSGMYKSWFLDYASYVILERAVPHIEDGLKPVQRRILHTMMRMDDGRYNKVANIVGETMKFHPHGDASIGDALVQMGQKDLLVDTQGNWGNILTGDRAAAPRYIEAKLSKFALETLFNPKTTEWQLSYDGRNREPITLPAKFPLLLEQGAEGIAVGLSSKIMPHNLNDICLSAVQYLHGKPFSLYPDFPTGGAIDVSKYNDGQRGGTLKVRAKIEKLDAKTLVVREIPYSKTAATLQDSITKAVEKGKLKIRKIEDMTAAGVEILLHLAPGTSPDKTIDALYAFTDCETNISPNCCVIEDNKPQFLTVSDVLKHAVDRTMGLLRRELQIRKAELLEQLFYASLERLFIEKRMYKAKQFEEAGSPDEVVAFLETQFEPFKKNIIREITRDDYLRLLEIKMQRILKYSKEKADELIVRIKKEVKGIDHDLAHMVDVTVNWFEYLQKKYGKDHPRRTEIRSFDTIEAAKVAEANEKLYINRAEGFIGMGLKKDEFVCNCSDIDDVILFFKDGKYKIIKVADKVFVGKGVIWIQVFKKNDRRTIYNAVYRDGRHGACYIKRFNVTSMTRDRDYDLTQGTKDSKVMYFSANPNGEAETIKITLDPDPKKPRQSIFLEKDFSEVAIKGRAAKGNLLTKKSVHRITLKAKGHSTLGGRKVWFDPDVRRLNYENRGQFIGEFYDDERLLVRRKGGIFYFTNFDSNNHYEADVEQVEKWQAEKVWSAVVRDADNGNWVYAKRFLMEYSRKPQSVAGDNPESTLILLTDTPYPRLKVAFGGADEGRADQEVDLESFIAVKSVKAKGKRLANWEISSVEELEPVRFPEPTNSENEEGQDTEEETAETENLDPDAGKSQQQVIDEMTGQLSLFDDETDQA